jgi:hypothetical protein
VPETPGSPIKVWFAVEDCIVVAPDEDRHAS